MKFEKLVDSDGYARWDSGRYIIAKYSEWNGRPGRFFMAYDTNNLSKRINQNPVNTFKQAAALCRTA